MDAMDVRPGMVFEDEKGHRREVVFCSKNEVTWRRPRGTKTSTAWCSTWKEWFAKAKRVDEQEGMADE